MKNAVRILIVITLNLEIAFGRRVIFTIFNLPIHKHERYFHFLVSFSISSEIQSFWCQGLFISLVNFIPRVSVCFLIFPCMVYGSTSMISLLACLLLAYRKATDFYKLILHHVTLMNVFIVPKSFLVKSLSSFM